MIIRQTSNKIEISFTTARVKNCKFQASQLSCWGFDSNPNEVPIVPNTAAVRSLCGGSEACTALSPSEDPS